MEDEMGKRKENANQHYVPQSYYRGFSSNQKGVQVYDWKRDIIYSASIASISSEPYFYDVDPKVLSAFVNLSEVDEQLVDVTIKNHIEDGIGAVFKSFMHLTEEMEKLTEENTIPLEEETAVTLRNFIIIQLIRTPSFRKQFENMAETIQVRLSEHETEETPIHELDLEEWTKIIHNVFLFGTIYRLTQQSDAPLNDWYKTSHDKLSLMVDNILDGMLEAGITFFHSETDIPFITSDNPVSIKWKSEIMADGFSTIFLPLNPKFALLLFDWDEHEEFREYNRIIYVIGDDKKEMLVNLNLVTTNQNTEKLYADVSYKFTEEKKYIKDERKKKTYF